MPNATEWLDRLSGSASNREQRARPLVPYLVMIVVGAVLFLPLLGRYGLWDPHEVRVAEIAREMAHDKTLSVPQRYPGRPALLLAAISLGYRLLGNSEIAGRLPVALLAISALCACLYAGTGLLRRRAALLGTLALCTMPVFFLGARQLTSAVAPILASSLALGGLARAAWPRRGEPAVLHLLVGVVGLALGHSAAGFALGVAAPLVALAVALLASSPAAPAGSGSGETEAAQGGSQGSDEAAPAGGLLLPRVAFGLAALGAVGLTLYAWWRALPTGAHPGYTWALAGTPHAATHQVQATTVLKQVGFSAFPWVALAPLALARLFMPRAAAAGVEIPGQSASEGRDAYGRYVLLAWALVTYGATTLSDAALTETTYGAFAAIALLAGAFLDDVWDDSAPQSVAAILAAAFAAIIAHDFFMAPEGFAGAHVTEGIKWPPLTVPPYVVLVAGLLWAVALALAVVMPLRPTRWLPSRQSLLAGALGVSLALTAATVYWMVPAISQHLSYKGLFVKYKSIVGTGESEIGKYHVPGQLSDYAQTTELQSLPAMFDFFARPKRVFVITSSDDLPAIDQYAKQRAAEPNGGKVDYFVIDDANSKFLMLSNQLGSEADKNPLRRFVIPVAKGLPKQPDRAMHADFEGKVELLGYDLPPELERGKPFKFTAYYKVNQAVVGAYKIFLHFDGPGTRFNGDHVPLDGKFATSYWVPGHYIIDEYTITPDRATQPSGMYTIYTGFWLGDQRLKVTAGQQDGENRVRVGMVRVK